MRRAVARNPGFLFAGRPAGEGEATHVRRGVRLV